MGKWRFEGSLLGHLCSEGWALRTSCCWPGSVGHCSSSNRKVRLVPIRLCPVSRPALLFNWRGPRRGCRSHSSTRSPFCSVYQRAWFRVDVAPSESSVPGGTLPAGRPATPAATCSGPDLPRHQSLRISLSLLLLSQVLNCCQNQYQPTSGGYILPQCCA